MSDNSTPPAGSSAPAVTVVPAASQVPGLLPAQSQAILDAINALPLETLQAERQRLVELRKNTADYDQAIAAKGGKPSDPKIAADYAAHGVSHAPAASDFADLNFGALAHTLPPENVANLKQAAQQFVADLRFSPEVARQLVSRLADIGPTVAKLSKVEAEDYAERMDRISMNIVKSPEALAKLKADAIEVLKMSGGEIASALAKSPVLSDPSVLRQLANHKRALALLKAKGR